ncbi:hypothetical protein G7A66_09060 [Altererythrobacter sp. SALINAS58]|uniref:hypothetical protein n=1 Tax=Alteripontixanthobacter muriae TaxID=2705546 RepID=UPI0019D5B2B6|nr:hypothetical protein [Alteripontixanthobacter muriae]NTZ43236.1 hypothetical protein [Alteripontixanthobacter muriae]
MSGGDGKESMARAEGADGYLRLMIVGWPSRYKGIRNGDRQIVGFMIHEDFLDLHVQILGAMDHSILTTHDSRVAFIPADEFEKLTSEGARLTLAL